MDAECDHYGTTINSCNKYPCSCGISQCPICLEKFVAAPNVVCEDCAPFQCESCENITTIAYIKSATKVTKHRLALKSMGYGAHEGRCKTCREWKTTGESGVCLECSELRLNFKVLKLCYECYRVSSECATCGVQGDILMNGNQCPSCVNSKWTKVNGPFFPAKCGVCRQMKVLNEESICEDCAKNSRCIRCGDRSMSNLLFCSSCTPLCVGCSKKFVALSRSQIMCNECKEKAKRGICIQCELEKPPLNYTGRCSTCEEYPPEASERYWCTKCSIKEVSRMGELCEECNKTTVCPLCRETHIRGDQYLCNRCLSIRLYGK